MLEVLVLGIFMNEINPIGTVSTAPKTKNLNFKAGSYANITSDDYDTFIKQKDKQQKQAKRKQNILTGLQAGAMLAIIASVGFAFFGSKFLGKSDKALRQMMERDLSKVKGFKDLNYNQEITEFVNNWKQSLENPQLLKDKGGEPIRTALLYGPPGTGKTTFVEAITKMFPDTKLFDLNVTQMGSEYQSVGERNFKNAIDLICKEADKNPKKKFIVLIDEIDSVMMTDNSLNAKHSNDMLNEFKKAFTEKLKKRDNIFTFGATNLDIDMEKGMTIGKKMLDRPMLDRFDEKVLIGLPNSKQLAQTIANNYSKAAKVPEVLKSADSREVKAIAEFLEKHGSSFRTLESLYKKSGTLSAEELTMKDFAKAIKGKQAELNFTDAEFAKLLSDLKINV